MYICTSVPPPRCAPPAKNLTLAHAARDLVYMVGMLKKMDWIEATLALNVSAMWIVSLLPYR